MVPLLVSELRERHPMSDTRVGHHGVDRSVPSPYRRHHEIGFLGVCDVQVMVLGLAAFRPDIIRDRTSLRFEYVRHYDPITRAGEGVGRSRADTDASAGDQSCELLGALHAILLPR
jgi:hypothetical protein